MKITGKFGKFDGFLLQEAIHYGEHGCNIVAKVGAKHLVGTETVKVHSEGWGDWYLFGGHCMWWGLIQANSLEDAYYIYLEEFVTPDDMAETEEELEYGTWDGCGGWYSELTTSTIRELGTHNYDEWDIEITPIVKEVSNA
jgi:hypothetical protein